MGESIDLDVFHGTNEDFQEFDISKAGSNRDSGFFGRGIYFSPEIGLAMQYGTRVIKSRIKGNFLEIDGNTLISQNFNYMNLPNEIDALKFQQEYEDKVREKIRQKTREKERAQYNNPWGGAAIEIPNENEFDEKIVSKLLTKYIIELGYDGVKGLNPISGIYEYVVFNTQAISTTEVISDTKNKVDQAMSS